MGRTTKNMLLKQLVSVARAAHKALAKVSNHSARVEAQKAAEEQNKLVFAEEADKKPQKENATIAAMALATSAGLFDIAWRACARAPADVPVRQNWTLLFVRVPCASRM